MDEGIEMLFAIEHIGDEHWLASESRRRRDRMTGLEAAAALPFDETRWSGPMQRSARSAAAVGWAMLGGGSAAAARPRRPA